MARSAALPALKAESGLSHYLDEIRRFPMLEPQQEYMLARSWREQGDREAAQSIHAVGQDQNTGGDILTDRTTR